MDTESQRRIARNEVLFREANEAIQRGLWPEQENDLVRFRCECAHQCNQPVELSPLDYERIRREARRFIVLDGHEVPSTEDVVERHERYNVVEKVGEGGEIAEELDPRH